MNTSMWMKRVVAVAVVLVVAPVMQAGPKVGMVLKARSGFWDAAEKGGRGVAETLGAELVAKAPQSESEIGAQVQMLASLVEQGCEAIVIAPSSKDTLVDPVASAVARGVKVVIIDTQLAREVAPVYVGTDQLEAGRAAGRLVASLVADGDTVCLFRHNQTSGATEQRENGALEALRTAREGLVLHGSIYASTEKGMETARANHLLNQDPNVKAVLASGTPGTMAMLHVLRDRGLGGKVRFVGFGYNLNRPVADALEQGVMDGWIAQLPGRMGEEAVKAAMALIQGEAVESVVTIPFQVITKENLRDPAVQALMFP
ncbi:MAG: substrate-binding domain-containing protein [Opitutaceae bacterium]|nr:substrate-binding domain-containing protein [Opitutaceae bacterium]